MMPTEIVETARQLVRPVYMPTGLRIAAVVVGLIIILPPLIHMVSQTYLMIAHPAVAELHPTTSDWPRLFQIIFGAGVGFPDPVVSMIRAWRAKGGEG